jgi:kynureninase
MTHEAARLDADDPLRGFVEEFHHPELAGGSRLLYLAGHSLGLQPKSAAALIEEELRDWRRLGVLGHYQGQRPWIGYHERLTEGLAELAGAHPAEVVAMNSLTVNLHLMMVSFFRPEGTRNRILIEQSAFPSDRYAVQSQLAVHGLGARQLVELAPRPGERVLRTADVIDSIERQGASLALVLLPGVQYLSGQVLDLAPLIEAARRVGARVGLDLAHAIGNVPVSLHDWGADFAVWCSYKYLNAGPGAIGGCFVHQRHATSALPRFAGWWGHDKSSRFRFEQEFRPIAGAEGWQLSNPPIFSSAPLIASLELFKRAQFERLRKKSLALTGYLRELLVTRLGGSLEVLTPNLETGCQLSVRLQRDPVAARTVQTELERRALVVDWREPDVIRLAPVPLYNTFSDVSRAVAILEQALC